MKGKGSLFGRSWWVSVGVVLYGTGAVWPRALLAAEYRWFKGNTHTHTWWSDGDSPPERAASWYKEHGYNFLVLSDHNILSEGEKWVAVKGPRAEAAKTYEATYGPDWVVKRGQGDQTEYQLKPLSEVRTLFEEPGRFLLIPGEEISDAFEKQPVHLNGINLRELVPPQKGATLVETIQHNVDAVLAQREKTGWPMFPQLNHPNFHWAITADDMAVIKGMKFFEVYNGHPAVHSFGDASHPSTDRMWDVVLTRRLAELNLPIVYGLATDDAHTYVRFSRDGANPGRGWVMVRARYLTPGHIVAALEAGDFYATTGVVLDDVAFEDDVLTIAIHPEPGVTFTTQFIGTLADDALESAAAAPGPTGSRPADPGPGVGRVLAQQAGPRASYRMTGRELYVRAKVIATKTPPQPDVERESRSAWVQPVSPRTRQPTK